MQKKILYFFISVILQTVIFLLPSNIQAQSEAGIYFGGSYYFGDLAPGGHFKFFKPGGGILYRHTINPRWNFKGNVLYGKIWADDAESSDDYQIERNLNFESTILEVATEFEFNFMPFLAGHMKYPFTPYIFGGLAIFKINPKAEYNGVMYELHNMSTEGQGLTAYPDKKNYSLVQLGIPFGVGLKLNIAENYTLGVEYGLRKTFTDYIDDVSTTYIDTEDVLAEKGPVAAALADRSLNPNNENKVGKQRGDSSIMDWYSFIGITFTINLGKKGTICNSAYPGRSKKYHEYSR